MKPEVMDGFDFSNNVAATAELNLQRTVQTSTKEKEASAIFQVLHEEDPDAFRHGITPLLLPEEKTLIEAAESLSLYAQAMGIFNDVILRLTYRWAEIQDWPMNAIASVVQPAKQVTPAMRCVVLNMPKSRMLHGRVAFKITEPKFIADRFPPSALEALANTKKYWKKFAYLEPIFNKDKILRSQEEVERWCRPKDPIIAGWLGSGPHNFGYNMAKLWEYRRHDKAEKHLSQMRSVIFLIAHWD
jgi:hypothetical protein